MSNRVEYVPNTIFRQPPNFVSYAKGRLKQTHCIADCMDKTVLNHLLFMENHQECLIKTCISMHQLKWFQAACNL
ncbi:MAG: hypothetical protein Q4B82_02335 [Alysiella sp.]|uniref:hypothetical protein n=1 Tax=Alysiella sp. TaxID=1872483 RepID=UPI0026DDBD63|nr:hypothetical protein [Alysiella sp.]MDO4433403.1 hypothetical protein [Alysiella sp.]